MKVVSTKVTAGEKVALQALAARRGRILSHLIRDTLLRELRDERQAEALFKAGTMIQRQAREARDQVSADPRRGESTEEGARKALDPIGVIQNRVMRGVMVQLHALQQGAQ